VTFCDQYGPWAVVGGASVGLGAEFARQLASRGLNLILLARRRDALQELAAQLAAEHEVLVRIAALDLGDPHLDAHVGRVSDDVDVGLLVFNAAYSSIGRFLDVPLEEHERAVRVNCHAPLVLAHRFGRRMAERGRGGIVLMSSMAGSLGCPFISTYAATKAFNIVLAESLWYELRERGVDVLACQAGATDTPGYAASGPVGKQPPVMQPAEVARSALAGLGRGPRIVPGLVNKLTLQLLGRLLPRRVGLHVIGEATRKLYGDKISPA